jgi:hypothetical protein
VRGLDLYAMVLRVDRLRSSESEQCAEAHDKHQPHDTLLTAAILRNHISNGSKLEFSELGDQEILGGFP